MGQNKTIIFQSNLQNQPNAGTLVWTEYGVDGNISGSSTSLGRKNVFWMQLTPYLDCVYDAISDRGLFSNQAT